MTLDSISGLRGAHCSTARWGLRGQARFNAGPCHAGRRREPCGEEGALAPKANEPPQLLGFGSKRWRVALQ